MTFVEVQGGALQEKNSADVFDAAQRPVRRDQQLSESLLDSCDQHLQRLLFAGVFMNAANKHKQKRPFRVVFVGSAGQAP